MSIEGQGHFFAIYFPGFVCFVLYQAKISGERLQDHWSSGYEDLTKIILELSSNIIKYAPYYTPGIYADGYIVFAFPLVRSSVRMFVSSFVRSWNLRQSFASKFLKWCISQQLLIRKHSYLDHSYPGGLAFNP